MSSLFSVPWLVLSFLVFLGCLIWAATSTNWQSLKQSTTGQHLFFGSVLALCCLWQIRAGIKPGLEVHFLGITAASLIMGWPLGILTASLALSSGIVFGWIPWSEFGLQGLIQVIVPAYTTWCGYQLAQRTLPPNPFIYLMVCGFFVGAVSMAAMVAAKALCLGLADIYSFEVIYHNYVRYLVLMMFPEGFVNGIILGAFFLISPHWIATFNEDVFFHDDDPDQPSS